jgi:hypothetical protein
MKLEIRYYTNYDDSIADENIFTIAILNNLQLFSIFHKIIFIYNKCPRIILSWNDKTGDYIFNIDKTNGHYTKLWIVMDYIFNSCQNFAFDFEK